MEVSAVGSRSADFDVTKIAQEVNQVQIEMIKKMLQAQADLMVGAEKTQQAEEVQGAVDYYA